MSIAKHKHADISFRENTFHLSGDLSFANVMAIYAKSMAYLPHCTSLDFNFSALTSSDSAGLALMIEWIHEAKKSGQSIHFTHLSQDLLSIAKAANLDEVLSLARA